MAISLIITAYYLCHPTNYYYLFYYYCYYYCYYFFGYNYCYNYYYCHCYTVACSRCRYLRGDEHGRDL